MKRKVHPQVVQPGVAVRKQRGNWHFLQGLFLPLLAPASELIYNDKKGNRAYQEAVWAKNLNDAAFYNREKNYDYLRDQWQPP